MRWDFFVRHYADEARQRRDDKLQPEGILYPRAGTLGGCTAHNAMILMAPHDADWDDIAALTGDPSWRATEMWRYFQKLESCRYRPVWHALSRLGLDRTGHGWDGWLPSERAMPWQVIEDRRLLATVTESAFGALHGSSRPVRILRRLLQSRLDPNDRRLLRRNADGLVVHAAQHASGTSGWERANGCSPSPAAIPISSGSSSIRWRHAFCSTMPTVPAASNT